MSGTLHFCPPSPSTTTIVLTCSPLHTRSLFFSTPSLYYTTYTIYSTLLLSFQILLLTLLLLLRHLFCFSFSSSLASICLASFTPFDDVAKIQPWVVWWVASSSSSSSAGEDGGDGCPPLLLSSPPPTPSLHPTSCYSCHDQKPTFSSPPVS